MLTVVNDFGVKLNVVVVPTGFCSHTGNHEVNAGPTIVEFFDSRSIKGFPPLGQFIAKLPLTEVLDSENGLQLSRLACEWTINQDNIKKIGLYVKVHEIV